MTAVPVSVVVVSRHRPAELVRCLRGLAQSDYAAMELVVVADPAGVAAAAGCGVGPLKLVGFDQANISAARNLGVAQAAGGIVAFIDDDAVPEPNWLSRLVVAFADPGVAIAGGFVRGRNGISFQWQARWVDPTGVAHPLTAKAPPGGETLTPDPSPRGEGGAERHRRRTPCQQGRYLGAPLVRAPNATQGEQPAMAADEAPSLHPGTATRAIKTEGTNMAVRRDVLVALGGFDEGFRFYLDETDLNLRAARAGLVTALVPGAQVHHGFAASARRRADRAPLDLTDIGASSMRFLRKHADPATHAAALARLRQEQGLRVEALCRRGQLHQAEGVALIRGLEAGIVLGLAKPLTPLDTISEAPPFLRLAGTGQRPWLLLTGWWWQGRWLRHEARKAVAAGRLVQVMLFAPTAKPHRMQFHRDGYWEQVGGLFGRSDRSAPPVRLFTLQSRARTECARLASVRDLGPPGG